MSEPASESHYEWSGRIRPLAICVFRRPDGAVLLAPGYDPVKSESFYRPLGGEIEFGETAEAAVRREIREEIGAEIAEPRLLHVFENIFVYLGKPGHELVWVFEARLIDSSLYKADSIEANEAGARFEARWVTPDELASGEAPLYPEGLLDLLGRDD